MFIKNTKQNDDKNIIVKDIQSCLSFLLVLSKVKLSLKNFINKRKIEALPKLLPNVISFKKPMKNRIK